MRPQRGNEGAPRSLRHLRLQVRPHHHTLLLVWVCPIDRHMASFREKPLLRLSVNRGNPPPSVCAHPPSAASRTLWHDVSGQVREAKRGEDPFAPSIGRIPWRGPSLALALWMLAGCTSEGRGGGQEEEGAQAEQSAEARPM